MAPGSEDLPIFIAAVLAITGTHIESVMSFAPEGNPPQLPCEIDRKDTRYAIPGSCSQEFPTPNAHS